MAKQEEAPMTISGQPCPMCNKKTMTLMESEREVPYFGLVYLFSMSCSNCNYHKADIEAEKAGEPTKWTIELSTEEDMHIRVVKSSEATIKIPRIMTIEPGPASNGYITNIEGILNRAKVQLENARDNAEEKDERKRAKNMLKKIQKIMWGQESIKITLEDPSGNSAIISEKATKSKLK
ncbi:ZPR1 zinc finger domain-containing protein [Candidatus Woesearchaeota archaeon]|nr:ZPR1 zinc finger domain-containing protein [Candidatus Woesearchaeota archaeon]